MTQPNAGRFTWHEVMTTDPAAAKKFYAALFGWTGRDMDMGPGGTYTMLELGGAPVGGLMKAQPGMPSAWLTYVETNDVDATAATVAELGGKLLVPPTDVPQMVRFAIAMDPQGAAFGFVKQLSPTGGAGAQSQPAPGTFCWNELHTKDQKAAGGFYGKVFGWTGKVGEDPMQYWHWMHEGKDIGGMMTLQMPNVPPHWLAYVASADVDASCAKAKELGAKVLVEPMDIPKVGKFAVLADPTGAAFAVYRSAHV